MASEKKGREPLPDKPIDEKRLGKRAVHEKRSERLGRRRYRRAYYGQEIPHFGDIDESLSSDYIWEQVFLSHSAKQRDFVEQLCIDLTRANISCFLDRCSFYEVQRFKPPHSFEAPNECEVAIVVLSEDYVASKPSMLQFCAFAEAEKTVNSKLKIYPIFYEISPDEFSQKIDDFEEKRYPESWSALANFSQRPIDFDAWLEALKALRSFKEPLYVQNDGTVDYRHKFLCDVHRLLSPNIKGKERLWQMVANLFEKTPYYKNGVKVIGLYGVDGSGKTTLCKSLCGFYSHDFEGKVFHAEFHKEGLPVETLKGLLQVLTDTHEESMKLVGNYEQALSLLKQQISSQRVFLCLDNIPDRLKSVKEAQAYLTAGFGEGSLVVLTARSSEILERIIPKEEKRSFVRVPNLTEEEAIDVLLNFTKVEAHSLAIEQKQIAAEYADLCRFGQGLSGRHGSYHPLALTILGAFLCEKYACNPSEWPRTPDFNEYASRHDAQEMIFYIFEQTFNALHPQFLRILLLLIFYVPNLVFVQNSHHSAFQWLADVCSHESNEFVRDAICSMKKRGLLEIRGRNSISFHDLLVVFGKSKLEGMDCWLSLEGKDELPKLNPSLVEVLKLRNYTSRRTILLGQFINVSVVHLESVENLYFLTFETMRSVISISIIKCYALEKIEGLRGLSNLRFLRVEGCQSLERCPAISHVWKLRHLRMQLSRRSIVRGGITNDLDLSGWWCLEEIYLDGISISFSRSMHHIRAVNINNLPDRIGSWNFTNCQKLQWIKLWNCNGAIIEPLVLTRCINVRSIYLHKNDYITEIVGLDELIALEELHLMEMNSVEQLPSFQQLRNLRHLTLRNMAKLKELPRVSNCQGLTKVDIDTNIGGNRIIIRDVSKLKEMQDQSDRIDVY